MGSRTPDCTFCKIVRKEADASIVDEDDQTISFLDIRPVNPGHALVIPKDHAAAVKDLAPEIGGRMFQRGMVVAAALRRSEVRCEAVTLHVADGEAAGQEVFHVHLHVIPRFHGDGFGLRFAPGYGRAADRGELDRIAEALRRSIDRH